MSSKIKKILLFFKQERNYLPAVLVFIILGIIFPLFQTKAASVGGAIGSAFLSAFTLLFGSYILQSKSELAGLTNLI